MAKKEAPSHVEVRALCALPEFGVDAGGAVTIPRALAEIYVEAGVVDDSPEAVEYAKACEVN